MNDPAEAPPGAPEGKKAPRVIGGFEILSKLGQGAMGMVLKARQVSMDRIVALKVLPPKIAQDQTFIERFQREARASAILNHPNIVQGIDVGQDPASGLWYFAMEYIDGPTLKQVLAQEKVLPERRVLEIGRDVAKALACAERNGIVHRDVKPDNILLNSQGEPKLSDLGLAKKTRAAGEDATLTQSGQAIGTPHYMAPEQVQGALKEIDIRTDIYALGATLFHLLTGRTPFEGPTAAVVMAKHLSEKPPLAHRVRAGEISEPASRLIAQMMEKEKDKRVQSARELVERFEKLLARERTSGPRAPVRRATTGPHQAVGRITTGRRAPIRGATTGPRAAVGARGGKTEEKAPPARNPKLLLMAGGAAAVMILIGLLVFGLRGGKGRPEAKTAAEKMPRKVKTDAGKRAASAARESKPAPLKRLHPTGKPPLEAGGASKKAMPGASEAASSQNAKEASARADFVKLLRFEGLQPSDNASRIYRLDAFLRKYGQTSLAQRARRLRDDLKRKAAGRSAGRAKAEPPSAPKPSIAKIPEKPDPVVAARLAFVKFSAEFLSLLRAGDLEAAAKHLAKAERNAVLKPLKEDLAQSRKALAWRKEIDQAALRGAAKLKEIEAFQIRLKKGQPIKVGKDQPVQVTEVKDGSIYVGSKGMSMPIKLANLRAETRAELVEMGLGRDGPGRLRRAFAKLLAMDGTPGAPGRKQVKTALAEAIAADAPAGEVDFLRGLLEVAEKGPEELAAEGAWKALQKKAQAGAWKALKKALAAFVLEHGLTKFAAGKKDELWKLSAKLKRRPVPPGQAGGRFYDFNTPESFAAFQRDFAENPAGWLRAQDIQWKGAARLDGGKLRVTFRFYKGAQVPGSKFVAPLEWSAKGLTWKGDWEFRLKLRHLKAAGIKSYMHLNLIFNDWNRADGLSSFSFRDDGKLSAKLIHGKRVLWSSPVAALRNLAKGCKLRILKQGNRLTCYVNGTRWVANTIPADLFQSMARSPVRLGFWGPVAPGDAFELDDLYFGPVRGAAGSPAAKGAATPPGAVPSVLAGKATGAVTEAFIQEVAKLPPGQQFQRVMEKIKELNPRMRIINLRKLERANEVYYVTLHAFDCTDLSPLRALKHVQELIFIGGGKTSFRDFRQLAGLRLVKLWINNTAIADLTPLRGLRLRELQVSTTSVADLTPLRGMPLETLSIHGTKVTDLTPLRGLPLKSLNMGRTRIRDLSPLKGMRLEYFFAHGARRLKNLSPLRGMPIKVMMLGQTGVTDLSPLEGMPLGSLNLAESQVADLRPLKNLPLASLTIKGAPIQDLSPLKGMPLRYIYLNYRPQFTPVLRSLKSLRLINGKPPRDFWKDVGDE